MKSKIVQVINSFEKNRGGAENLALELHHKLLSREIDAHIIAIENCQTSGIQNAVSLGFSGAHGASIFFVLENYLKLHFSSSAIVHAHLFPTSAYIMLAKKLGRLDCCCLFTEHSTQNRRRNLFLGKIADRIIYSEFEKIVAVSQGAKNSLLSTYPNLSNKTTFVRNGVDLKFDKPLHRSTTKCPVILSVGRLTSAKNLDGALRAMAKLGGVSYQYFVLGEGVERRKLENLATELGVESRVTFKGHVSNIQPYLEMADIFLMPSRWEGFGLAAVEAMNAALPVIASDVPGLREVIGSDGESGLLVSPDSSTEIFDALTTLMNQRELRSKMGLQGFKRAKLFSSKIMADSYIDIYRGLGLRVS